MTRYLVNRRPGASTIRQISSKRTFASIDELWPQLTTIGFTHVMSKRTSSLGTSIFSDPLSVHCLLRVRCLYACVHACMQSSSLGTSILFATLPPVVYCLLHVRCCKQARFRLFEAAASTIRSMRIKRAGNEPNPTRRQASPFECMRIKRARARVRYSGHCDICFAFKSQSALLAQVAFCLYNGFCIAGCGVGVAAPGCPTRVPGSWVLGGDVQQGVDL